MATYINTVTNEYPLYPGDMELRFPDFDETNVPEGYAVVVQPEIPDWTEAQRVEELAPILVNGVWTKQYAILDLTQEEIAANEVARKAARLGNRNIQNLNQSGSAPNVIE